MNQEIKYDVISLGGGISATLLAIQLLKKQPQLKIAIVEKSIEFHQKLGESTSDITAICIRSFGIDHLLKNVVSKSGLRFLFNEDNNSEPLNYNEFTSPSFNSQYTGFQFNRKTFDQELLDEASKLGATIYRPAELIKFEHQPFHTTLKIKVNAKEIDIYSKWFVDATGTNRFVHHELKWKNIEVTLNTSAVYAHFTHLAPVDDWQIEPDQYWKEKSIGDGSFGTIHFMRPYRWWWLIRIDDVTTSIGVVFDKNKIQVDDAEEFLRTELTNDVQLNRITHSAKRTAAKHIKQVAYQSEQLFKDGIILIGDSACTTDPLQSPGIELICQQVIWISDLISQEEHTKIHQPKKWKRYEKIFTKAFSDRLEIYKVGYNFINSHDLFKNWLRAGALGYFGNTVFKSVLFSKMKKYPFRFNFFYKLGFRFLIFRLNKIQARRIKQNRNSKITIGKHQHTGVYYSKGILFFTIPLRLFAFWLVDYVKLEVSEMKYWFRK